MGREIDTQVGMVVIFVVCVIFRSLPSVSPLGVGFLDKAESYTLIHCTH